LVVFVAAALRSISFFALFDAARNETPARAERMARYATLNAVVIAVSVGISALMVVALARLARSPETRSPSRAAMIMVFVGWAVLGTQMFGTDLLPGGFLEGFVTLSIIGSAVLLAERVLVLAATHRAAKVMAAEPPTLLVVLIAAALGGAFLLGVTGKGLRLTSLMSDGASIDVDATTELLASVARWAGHLSTILFVVLFGGVLIKSRSAQ
jgi:hypothetical protein